MTTEVWTQAFKITIITITLMNKLLIFLLFYRIGSSKKPEITNLLYFYFIEVSNKYNNCVCKLFLIFIKVNGIATHGTIFHRLSI